MAQINQNLQSREGEAPPEPSSPVDLSSLPAHASGIAPADAKPRTPWPTWKIVLAYALMFAIALASIWIIDGHVLAIPGSQAP